MKMESYDGNSESVLRSKVDTDTKVVSSTKGHKSHRRCLIGPQLLDWHLLEWKEAMFHTQSPTPFLTLACFPSFSFLRVGVGDVEDGGGTDSAPPNPHPGSREHQRGG